MGCSNVENDMPDDLGCLKSKNSKTTLPRKETAYLNNMKTNTRNPTLLATFLAYNEDALLEWWVTNLKYGDVSFVLHTRFFGVVRRLRVRFIRDLVEEVDILHNNLFELEVLNIDEAMVKPYYVYELDCGLDIECGHIIICT